MIGETSNPIFPQENDGLKRIRNSLRILKRSSKQHPFPYDDLPLNLGMDFFLRAVRKAFLHFLPDSGLSKKSIKNLAKNGESSLVQYLLYTHFLTDSGISIPENLIRH